MKKKFIVVYLSYLQKKEDSALRVVVSHKGRKIMKRSKLDTKKVHSHVLEFESLIFSNAMMN
jgi:hypothetical protein